jgi:aryl-alcohol dehydrogenase-like predicted oxidoreductase
MNFGEYTSESVSHNIMDKAVELGINFFDTADCYGLSYSKSFIGDGITEEIIGRWLAKGGNRREKIVLATKVYARMGMGPNEMGLSAYHIRRACEDSLRRLQTDHIDLYQMHHIDRDTPWEEIWQAMEKLVREGKITYVGCSNFAGWNIVQAQCTADNRNFMGLVSAQDSYNLCGHHARGHPARMIELEVIPACRALGIGFISWSPMGGGLLTGVLGGAAKGRKGNKMFQKAVERHHTQLEEYESLCQSMGEKPANIALAWVLSNPSVTSAIIGPRTQKQLEDSLNAIKVKMSDGDLKRLDDIWPGPGGEAPEAYAW